VFPVNSDDDVDFLIKHVMGIPEDPKKSTIQLQEYKNETGQLFYLYVKTEYSQLPYLKT